MGSTLLGVLVFLFWWLWFPQALSFHEQYQLFLFSTDYFCQRMALPGGLADYVSEFLVQFYYIPWLGALVLALLSVLLQQCVWHLMNQAAEAGIIAKDGITIKTGMATHVASFVPSILVVWMMGDESVLLSYIVALLMVLWAAIVARWWDGCRLSWPDLFVVPLLYYLAGPLVWLYVLLRLVAVGKQALWLPVVALACQLTAYFLLPQWPTKMVACGLNYYRTPEFYSHLQWVMPLVIVLLVAIARFVKKLHPAAWACLLVVMACGAVAFGYDSDKWEVIRQDWLVRNERWADVISRAAKHEVHDAFWCNCVNLALAKERRLADSMFDFYQSGEDALLMPMHRDMVSNIPTAEAFWHLGMVNSARRYTSDLQEAILNARKSGRFTKRIAECHIVNGQYALAAKHLALLRQSLFYRQWAHEAEQLLYRDGQVDRHPLYGHLRQVRYKDDFLYSYPEIDKMLGLLFVGNHSNTIALDYFMGQLLLKGDVQAFMQYMSWVQQYGGYQFMPRGYQDAVRCIQSHGQDQQSAYGRYVRTKMGVN